MSYISNFPGIAIIEGVHPITNNMYLIRIFSSSGSNESKPKYHTYFKKIYQFRFDDLEKKYYDKNILFDSEMAKEIISILNDAIQNNIDVLVHCDAGISRSGAIVDIALDMGFKIFPKVNYNRQPNSLVRKLLLNELGFYNFKGTKNEKII